VCVQDICSSVIFFLYARSILSYKLTQKMHYYSPKYEKEFGCRKQLMDEKYQSKHPIRKDSDTWKLLLEQNRFDVHLYDFAKELFSQQSYIFGL
jgi:hypothetical protein